MAWNGKLVFCRIPAWLAPFLQQSRAKAWQGHPPRQGWQWDGILGLSQSPCSLRDGLEKEDVVSACPLLSLLCPGHIFPSLTLLCCLIPPTDPQELGLDRLENAGQLLVPRNGAGCCWEKEERRGERCRRTAQPGENTLKNKSKETRGAREKNSDESLNSASLSRCYLSCGT